MLFGEVKADTSTFTALGGGSIRVEAPISTKAVKATGLELADLSIKARLVSADTYAEALAPVAMTGVPGANGAWLKGTIVVGAAALAAGEYKIEVYLAGDIEPTVSARAKGAPATIDATEVPPALGPWFALT